MEESLSAESLKLKQEAGKTNTRNIGNIYPLSPEPLPRGQSSFLHYTGTGTASCVYPVPYPFCLSESAIGVQMPIRVQWLIAISSQDIFKIINLIEDICTTEDTF